MAKTFSREEVAQRNTEDAVWCIIDHRVYDLTDFLDAHPGGSVVLSQVAGKDATAEFYNLHRQEVLDKYQEDLCVGTVAGETPEIQKSEPGSISEVPYAEPMWLRSQFKSPYYKESHRKLQKAVREFTDRYITPEAQEKERDGTYISQELIDRMAETNILAMRLGPGKHLHGRTLLGGAVDPKEFDFLHDLVMAQELVRANARGMLFSFLFARDQVTIADIWVGFQDGNMAGMAISLTAVQHWLRNIPLREKITEEVLSGKKKMCLAITEAFAGSDVAGLKTTAEKTPDGKFYVVNGTKYVGHLIYGLLLKNHTPLTIAGNGSQTACLLITS